jgi:hypothetical protein
VSFTGEKILIYISNVTCKNQDAGDSTLQDGFFFTDKLKAQTYTQLLRASNEQQHFSFAG